MNKKPENLYQLRKALLEIQNNKISERIAGNFINNVTCAFAEKNYFKEPDKGQYYYTEDFVQLVLTLAELDHSNNTVHTYLLQCKKCSISFTDMEHFLYLLMDKKKNFSESLSARIQDVLSTLHLINYDYKRLVFITDENSIKKKLLFYLVTKENQNNQKITQNLTLSELHEKLYNNTINTARKSSFYKPCEI